jgi:Winged helix-turn-helix DNA-binding
MARDKAPTWSFLTNHARVLLCIAEDPGIRLREIGDGVGITERAVHRIVVGLAAAGYISRTRNGRRTHYTIQSHLPVPDSADRSRSVGDLLAILAAHVSYTKSGGSRRASKSPTPAPARPRRERAVRSGVVTPKRV